MTSILVDLGSTHQELKGNVFQTAISYNIGFFGSIGEGVIEEQPSRIDRRDAIVDQLKNSDADVICLQEVILVWYPTTIFLRTSGIYFITSRGFNAYQTCIKLISCTKDKDI